MFKNFLKNEEGAEVIEYIGLIAIGVLLILAAKGVGDAIATRASQAQTKLTGQLDEMIGG